MNNKKRINDRMVMLQKRSTRIEKARRDMMFKVIFRLGIESAKSSRALQKFSDAILHALPNYVDEFRGVFEEGSERIVCANGSVKAQKLGVISGGTYGSNALNLIKPGTELFMIRKDSTPTKINNKHESYLDVMGLIPKVPNVIFDETTMVTPKMLEGVMAISKNSEGISKSVFYGSRDWVDKIR